MCGAFKCDDDFRSVITSYLSVSYCNIQARGWFSYYLHPIAELALIRVNELLTASSGVAGVWGADLKGLGGFMAVGWEGQSWSAAPMWRGTLNKHSVLKQAVSGELCLFLLIIISQKDKSLFKEWSQDYHGELKLKPLQLLKNKFS